MLTRRSFFALMVAPWVERVLPKAKLPTLTFTVEGYTPRTGLAMLHSGEVIDVDAWRRDNERFLARAIARRRG